MSGARLVTVEEFAEMPDEVDAIEELIAGAVYRSPVPGFTHGECLAELGSRVIGLVKSQRLGRCATLSGFVAGRNPDTVLCPDFGFWSSARPPDIPKGWPTVPPRLVAEVVHGVSEYNHAILKMPYYLACGVDVVWVVGLRRRAVEVHRRVDHPDPFDPWEWRSTGFGRMTHLGGDATLDGGEVLPGFSCKVADLFA